jgi:hypothetical protein
LNRKQRRVFARHDRNLRGEGYSARLLNDSDLTYSITNTESASAVALAFGKLERETDVQNKQANFIFV